jgi:hypothetical protein
MIGNQNHHDHCAKMTSHVTRIFSFNTKSNYTKGSLFGFGIYQSCFQP